MQGLTGKQGIFQQLGAGHWANTTRHRGNKGSARSGGFKIDVTNQLAIGHTVNAHINDNGAFFNPFTFHNTRLTHGHHHNVGLAHMAGGVGGEAMAGGYGAAFQQQFQPHRPANNVGSAHDHSMLATDVYAGTFQQVNNAKRRAGAQHRHTLSQATDVERVETVNVFGGVNALQNLVSF